MNLIWKNRGFIAIASVFVLLAAGVMYYFYKRANTVGTTEDYGGLPVADYAAAEIKKARQLFSGGPKSAYLIEPVSNEKVVALVFDGLPDKPLMERIIDILKSHKVKAVFFAEGQNAADEPGIIQLAAADNQEIGNFTFAGVAAVEKLTPDQIIEEVCKAQKAIKTVTGQTPRFFRAHRTRYTPAVLKAVGAAGIEGVVHVKHFFPRGTLKNDIAADAYAGTLTPGAIVAVGIGVPAEVNNWKSGKTDEKAAIDKKPTIQDRPVQKLPADGNNILIDELDRFLYALERKGIKVKPVQELQQKKVNAAGAVVKINAKTNKG